jgi:putative membrane-bound dehydrogenase-like protein
MPHRCSPALLFLVMINSPAFGDQGLPKVPDGFKVELVLQAPEIEAPTALCVAPNGDVYFAEDPMDMRGPPTKNIDKIWLLKGGDPKKKVLFAEHMWAVMGLEIVRDKLYVVHAPYVTVFTLDKEGKASKREDLFTDLGPPVAGVPSFNDHIPSGIRMGIDGWLYVSIGDKGIPKMTRKETNEGSVHVAEGRWRHSNEGHHISLEGGGVIRFRPDGCGLEVFASGTRNHLDVPLDEHDRIFVRDNTDDGLGWWTRLMYLPRGAFMGYPWAYTKRPNETLPMVRDFGGGAPCGGWVYCDDGLPETYHGRVFHCEWGQGKVQAVKLAADGAGFKFADQITFMDPAGKVKDFRPFTLRPTADGRGFYVTDWGYGGWLTDKKVGRLWKVTYARDDVKPAPRGKDTDSVKQLLRALEHPALSERLRAQRELVARGVSVVGELKAAVEGGQLSPLGLRHALWAFPDDSQYWAPIAEKLAQHPDPAVRFEAVRIFGRVPVVKVSLDSGAFFTNGPGLCSLLERVTLDPDPAVRHQAALILRIWGTPGPLNWLAVEKDRHVRFAMINNLKKLRFWSYTRSAGLWKDERIRASSAVRDALIAGLSEEYDTKAVSLLREGQNSEDATTRRMVVEALARVYKDRKPYAGSWWGTQPAGRKPPLRELIWEGTPLVRKAILDALTDADKSVRHAAVTALVAAEDPETFGPIIAIYGKEKDASTRADLVRAISGLATPNAVSFLIDVLADRQNAEPIYLAAIAGLEKADTAPAANSLAKAADSGAIAVRVRALEALGSMKSGNLIQVVTHCLKDPESSIRKAAVNAVGSRRAGDAALLLPLLDDTSIEVQTATARALGELKDRGAVPALVSAAGNPDAEFDAITALTKMPDRRALTAYLTGLTSKNVELRKASAAALAVIRVEAAPELDQLARRNEIRAEVLPELRNVYAAFVPVIDWKIIGPFPDNHEAHPPEKEQRLDATYRSFDRDVSWVARKGDARNHGIVRLDKMYVRNLNVVAYAYAELQSDTAREAVLQVGSDDTIAIWVNSKQVHHYDGSRGWSFDQDKVHIHLNQGVNRLLVRCGNFAGPWEFSIAVSGDVSQYAFLKGGAQKFDLETFRTFARKNPGDTERGRKLFLDVKGLACVKCHSVSGEGGKVGPDLAGIALKYKREDLMTSVLEPSKTIAQGYETIVLNLNKGTTVVGVFKGESADAVNLADAEGKALAVAKKDIESRFFSPVSTMPNGLSDGMTLQDFADLVAYLEARREEPAVKKK